MKEVEFLGLLYLWFGRESLFLFRPFLIFLLLASSLSLPFNQNNLADDRYLYTTMSDAGLEANIEASDFTAPMAGFGYVYSTRPKNELMIDTVYPSLDSMLGSLVVIYG